MDVGHDTVLPNGDFGKLDNAHTQEKEKYQPGKYIEITLQLLKFARLLFKQWYKQSRTGANYASKHLSYISAYYKLKFVQNMAIIFYCKTQTESSDGVI